MTVTEALAVLTELGIAPVITLAATLGVAVMLYKRFRR